MAPPNSSAAPAQAARGYNDADWEILDLPHDFEVSGSFGPLYDANEGFLPYSVAYYRKHISLPANWTGTRVELYVEGALSASQWWINGVPLSNSTLYSSYTSHILRLDTCAGIVWGGANVITAYVDGTLKTGWWYEGAGLYRRMSLTSTPLSGSIATHGLWSPATVSVASIQANGGGAPAAGLTGAALFSPSVQLRNDGPSPSNLSAVFTLVDAAGNVAASASSAPVLLQPNGTLVVGPGPSGSIPLPAAQLWSVPRPYLYTLAIVLLGMNPDDGSSSALDAVNTSVGIRTQRWDANSGLWLNNQSLKIRGFCNHENFGAIGAAIPPRVDLLRLQQLRGVGGNGWRTSHNAPEPHLLDLTDRLGAVVMDENRVFAGTDYLGNQVQDMSDLVSRDRNHPSIAWWSFCNEGGCGDGDATLAGQFRNASYAADGSRPVGANMIIAGVSPMSEVLDVMGFSHFGSSDIQAFHEAQPNQPLVSSECCSCETQRGEDADQPQNSSEVFFSDESSGCLSGQTQISNSAPYNAGTMIWTLHDYLGEPGNWPHVSSSFGSFDVGGIPKAASFWLRAWWLSHIPSTDAGRPPLSALSTATTVYLVESWQPQLAGLSSRTLNGYSNAPFVALSVNGVPFGAPVAMPSYGSVTWGGVPFAPGSVTITALASATGPALAAHTRYSWGSPASLSLTCDAPNPATGTGSAVYLDGTDVALLRVTVVDAAGVPVANSTANITFSVVSGPGLILGVVNGDPANHQQNGIPWHSAYHGMLRGIVRANLVAVGDTATLAAVNSDAGGGSTTAALLPPGSPAPTSMTIMVTSPGLAPATIVIPLSTNPADEVLAVASASVGVADPGTDGPMTFPSQSPTPSTTLSGTPTLSATLSLGSTSSHTSTGSPTPTSTPSPGGAVNAVTVSVALSGCLNAVEVIVVDVLGRNLARTANVSATNVWGSQGTQFLNNGLADPTNSADVFSGTCASTAPADAVTLALASPAIVADVYFVNRENTFAARISAGAGSVATYAVGGGLWGVSPPGALSSAAISRVSFVATSAPQYPQPGDPTQSNATLLAALPRFVTISAPVGSGLSFRELFAYTAAHVNVALLKSTTTTSAPACGGTPFSGAAGVDGDIDIDGPLNTPTVQSPCASVSAGDTAWTVDLGGAYPLAYLQVFNVYSYTDSTVGGALAGATLSAVNSAGATVATSVLAAVPVQTVTLVLFPPLPCSSPTPPSLTPTSSSSRSLSSTLSSSRSVTGTTSLPPSRSPTRSYSSTATLSGSVTSSLSVSASSSVSASGSNTMTPTGTTSATVSKSLSRSRSPTSSLTGTASSSSTHSRTASATHTISSTRSSTHTPRVSDTGSSSGSASSSLSASSSVSSSASLTGTPAATASSSRSPTDTAAFSGTPTVTVTASRTATSSASNTPAASISLSAAATPSHSGSAPVTPQTTLSRSRSSTRTATLSRTESPPATASRTSTRSPSSTRKPTGTPSNSRKPKR